MPLSGLRVLEFGYIAAAPFCGMLLAGLGADVVKVEGPQGDGMRGWPPFTENAMGDSFSLYFAAMNRGKRRLVADLKNPGQLARVRKLCARADVILENYRPGVLDRLGVGFQDVARLREGLVYCSISGYGHHGSYAARGAFEVVIQGMSGLISVTGEEGRPPVKCGVPVADFTAGLYAACTILAGREVALREHRAVYLDCAMLDCLLGISALQTGEYWATGTASCRLGSAHPRNAPYQAFEASDGYFTLAAGNDQLWRKVCSVIGQPPWASDRRFASVAQRARHQKELAPLLQEVFRRRSVREWLAEFAAVGLPGGPVNTFADILEDPELAASGLIEGVPLPVGGKTRATSYPVRFDGARLPPPGSAPRLGEHTVEVLQDWLAVPPDRVGVSERG